MAEHRQVRYEHLYVKEPNGDALRDSAAGHLKHLLSDGWREVERVLTPDYVKVRLERSGHAPLMKKLPVIPVQQGRPPRDGQSRGGPRGGAGGPRGGGAPRGPGAAGAPRGPGAAGAPRGPGAGPRR